MTTPNPEVNPNPEANEDGDNTSKATEKTFTQGQLDAIIDARLKREKLQQSQNLDEVKAETTRLSKEVENKDTMLSKYEEILKGIVKKQLKDLPKPMRQLVEKLDPAEQLVWLEANSEEIANLTPTDDEKKKLLPLPRGKTSDEGFTLEEAMEQNRKRVRYPF